MNAQIQLDVKKLVTDAFTSSYTLLAEQGHRVHIWYRPKTHVGFLEQHKSQEGVITLNLSPESVHNFGVYEHYLSFQARFNGKPENIMIPLDEIDAIIDVDVGAAIPYPFTSFFIQLKQIVIAEKSGKGKLTEPTAVNEPAIEEKEPEEFKVSEETVIKKGWSPRLITGGKK
jgi:stringent starvation protein B